MTGPEHYREAERLLEEFGQEVEVPEDAAAFIVAVMHGAMARAQVHATLAVAAGAALNDTQVGMTGNDHYERLAAAATKPKARKAAKVS
jgi:hypothetical protein